MTSQKWTTGAPAPGSTVRAACSSPLSSVLPKTTIPGDWLVVISWHDYMRGFAILGTLLFCLTPTVCAQRQPESRQYVGSPACKNCHSAIYERWRKTRMANVIRDPREHPDAIIPDLSKPDPLVKFSKDDIAFVYGSKWKQRYFKKVGDDYFPLEAQWDVTHRMWRAYHVAPNTDWWTAFYPSP